MNNARILGDKTVLIAGGAATIGASIAKKFADLGASVVVVDANEAALIALAQYRPDRIEPLCMDLESVKNSKVLGEMWESTPIQFLYNLQQCTTNLLAAVRRFESMIALNKSLLPALIEGRGNVVTLCPVQPGLQGEAILGATTRMVTTCARDYALMNVRINGVLHRSDVHTVPKGLVNALMFFGHTKVITGAVVEAKAMK